MDFAFGKGLNTAWTPQPVESIDKVPEQFRAMYVAGEGDNEGKFVLSDDHKPAAQAIDGFNHTNRTLRTEVTGLKAGKIDLTPWVALGGIVGLAEGEEANPETIKAAIEKLQAQPGQSKANFERMKRDLEVAMEKAVKAKDGELTKAHAALEKYLVEGASITAITNEKGVPALLLPWIKQHVKVVKEDDEFFVRVVDDEGAFRGGPTGGHMTISELVKELKGDTTFGRAFESEQHGSATGNPPPRSTTASTTTTAARAAATVAAGGQGDGKSNPTDRIRAGLEKRSGGR
jgi:hypothetical protein